MDRLATPQVAAHHFASSLNNMWWVLCFRWLPPSPSTKLLSLTSAAAARSPAAAELQSWRR